MSRVALMATAVVAGLGAGAFGIAAASADPDKAQAAQPLTTDEVYQLYANRSWMWNEGAGYFAAKRREFSAWTGEGGEVSYGIGRWFITSPGKLCFRAEWRAMNGSNPALTCFSHREQDGVIYQKREPDGEWYVFRQMPAMMSDEYAKLRHGDYVATRMRRIEARLDGG